MILILITKCILQRTNSIPLNLANNDNIQRERRKNKEDDRNETSITVINSIVEQSGNNIQDSNKSIYVHYHYGNLP